MEVPQTYHELTAMLESLYEERDGCAFYEYLFPENEKQGEQEQRTDFSRPNAIYLYQDERDKGTGRRLRPRIMLSDVWEDDYYEYIENKPLTLCSGLSYRGCHNRLQNAQRMNALVFDLDGVGEREARNLFLRFGGPANRIRTLPMPTFLVPSGAGIHVYYVFERPIDLYPNIKLQLKALKYDLTFRMWEYKATSTKKEIQYQSINQTFRMVGSVNEKYGNVLRAFQTGDKVTLEHLNQYARPENRVDVDRPYRPSQVTRAQAREAYPEWYQRVVVEGGRRLKKWDIKGKQGYALYEWWLRRVGEIKGGHRYYYLMCLVIYACKCDVPRERLEADMQAAYEQLRLVQHDNVLTKEDIRSALETYDKEYYNFTIADIEKLTDVRIERNKRNGRKQEVHMKVMSGIRNVLYPDGGWRNKKGRPTAEAVIRDFLMEHPGASKAEVIRGTGRDKKTVYKYCEGWVSKKGRPTVEVVIREFLVEHPGASKAEVIRGTGRDKKTVYKYYDSALQCVMEGRLNGEG